MQTIKPGSSPILKMRGVGPQLAKKLAKLNLHSPEDLLLHFPYRYQDRSKVQTIKSFRSGDQAVIEGVIQSVSKPPNGKTKLLCELHDGSARVWLRFFHVYPAQSAQLQVGSRLRCYQQVRLGPKGLEMVHPEYRLCHAESEIQEDKYLTAYYPATEGVSQHLLRKLTDQALAWMKIALLPAELLPQTVLDKFSLPNVQEAIAKVHRPENTIAIEELNENKTPAQKRLVFEELIAHRLSLLKMKRRFQNQQGILLKAAGELSKQFLEQLPFALTRSQYRVIDEINQDLQKPSPMLRLVQGDVGSGKTVVAAMAMLRVVESGYQAALMAPTELLAEQHQKNFKAWFEKLGIKTIFLSGSSKAAERREALAAIDSGEAMVAIGTHALFQEKVNFARLALIVVDEQHRFGVQQRAMFRSKGQQQEAFPHQLIMTATPIPRTLAMSFYADLDCSSIDELPPGRTPVVTSVVAASKREEVIQKIKSACLEGKQVYWVCPLIEESEVINAQAATVLFSQLQQVLPKTIKVGLVHGRMRADEKEKVMQAFKAGDTHLLVATTVIEVGVDVPNASLMMIENAERLGLSQLHQLRGRVGRGSIASYCLLLYDAPLSNMAKERLSVMRNTNDGFKIAQRDLELRGPGEILGTRQTGELSFRFADLMRDSDLLVNVNEAADIILRDYPNIIDILIRRWLGHVDGFSRV